MHDFQAARIKKMVIHLVGNKGADESLVLGENHVRTLEESEDRVLTKFFFKSF